MKALAIVLAALTMTGASAAFAATDSKTKTATVKSPESIECSKQADAKGLHGAERKKFRAECKKELKAKATMKASGTPPAAAAIKADAPASTSSKTEAPTTPTKN